MVDRMNASGCKTVAISESKDTPVAKKAKCYVDMGCGKEEYVYRTNPVWHYQGNYRRSVFHQAVSTNKSRDQARSLLQSRPTSR